MEIQPDTNYFSKYVPSALRFILTGLASVFVGVYFEKFRRKITLLKYKILFQPLATTDHNEYWGDISVFHNNRIVKHLSFVTVEVKNDSNQDLENINVDFWVDPESQFLGVSGNYIESGHLIFLEKESFDFYNDVIRKNFEFSEYQKNNPELIPPLNLVEELKFVTKNKRFHLPVFNRKTSIRINLLVENFKGVYPKVTTSVLHKSVKLILEEDQDESFKKTLKWMIFFGLIIYIIAISLLLSYYSTSKVPIIIVAVIGLTYSIIGLGIYKLIELIKRLLWE